MRIRKPAIFWLSGFIVILAACTGAQQTEPPPTATAEPVTTATVETTTTVETATTVAPTTSVPSCEELVAGTTPPARGFAPMVTLGAEGGVLLFGGETAPPPLGGEVLTDTWTLSQASWTNLTRCPSPPWGEGAAYDAESERVILIGGTLEGWTEVREVWAFDPTSAEWSQLEFDEGPDSLAKLSYDAESDRIITFDEPGDIWAYDFNSNTWQEMRPATSPPGRDLFAMAYDSESDRIILFGGYGTGELDDTWAYDYNTNTWTEMAPEFSPGLRSWHSMAYDAATQKVVFFGGAPRRDPLFHDDTWLYDPSANTWSPLGGVVVGGVTLTSAGCEYAGPSEIPVGDLTFRLRQKNTGRFNLDAFLLDEGHGYDEFVAHIDEERRRNRAGEPHQGPPNSFASLVGQASAEVDAIADLDIDAGPGTYALACIHIEESGAPGDIWAAGPITVSD